MRTPSEFMILAKTCYDKGLSLTKSTGDRVLRESSLSGRGWEELSHDFDYEEVSFIEFSMFTILKPPKA